jgi:hypothetical protein
MSSIRGRVAAEFSFERGVRADLRERRWIRLHVFLIGLVTFVGLWALSHALMVAGVASMAARHGVALVAAYLLYLGLLWLWCRWLLSRDEGTPDLVDPGFDLSGSSPAGAKAEPPVFRSGDGGDFGGGGATGNFDAAGEAGSAAADAGVSAIDKVASGAAEAVGGADEGAVVLVPVAIAVAVALALAAALGFAVFGLFGVEVLMGVAVEIAFASAGGAIALKAQREGWLEHAVRRTVGPMSVVLAATVAMGLAIGHWLPQASTLPQALRLLLG